MTVTPQGRIAISDRIKWGLFRHYRDKEIKEHRLRYIFWECTLRCNLHCKHCGSDCKTDSSVPDMPLQDFIKILMTVKERFHRTDIVIFITGGEPLLRHDLEEAGRQICSLGFEWGIVTNGLIMTPERFSSLVYSGLTSLSVSLDGLRPEHSYLRQNEHSFDSVINTITMCVERSQKVPEVFSFDVITCVHHGNIQILPKLRELLIDMGVSNWRVFSVFPSGRAGQEDLGLSPLEYRALMEFIVDTRSFCTAEGRGIHLSYSCEGYLGSYELKVRDYPFFCRAGISTASVMCNGDIASCLSIRGKDFVQGNIYTDDFITVWDTCYKNMRDRCIFKKGRCRNCKSWKNCLGNSLHLHPSADSECAYCNLQTLESAMLKENAD